MSGFTLIEVLIVITIISILSVIGIVAYNGSQQRASEVLVMDTVANAHDILQLYSINNRVYPSNIADTNYAPPLTVALALYTNAPQSPVYSGLTADQNAQLFINACNGYMPIVSGGTTYTTSCVYSGKNLHIKGQVSSNIIINGPTVNQSDFVLNCGSTCTTAQNSIVSTFLAQGGTFPITVPKAGSALPAPTMVNAGDATTYCVEGRSPTFSSIVYHATPDVPTPQSGPCPVTSPALHYP